MGFSSSSSRRAKAISSIASRLFFLLIILQFPLFRIQCRIGTCTTPLQITSSQLIASEILPVDLVKLLLYPGAVINALFDGLNIPTYGNLLEFYNLTHAKHAPATIDLRNLEILVGSYLSVAGAILGVIKQGRLSLFGMVLLLWGLFKEVIREQPVHISPIIFPALLASQLSIKADIREILRSFRAHHSAIKATQLHQRLKRRRKEREMKRLEWTVNYVSNSKTPRTTKPATFT